MPFRRLGDPWKTLGGHGGTLGAVSGGEVPLNFFLRDEFYDEALVNPRTANPGPGVENIVDVEGVMLINNNRLQVPSQATPVWGEEGWYADARARTHGDLLMWCFNGTASGNSAQGWNNAQDIPIWNGMDHAIRGALAAVTVGTTSIAFTPQAGIDLLFALILRATGCHYLVKGGTFTEWTRIWVDNAQNTATLYPTITNFDGDHEFDYFRGVPLPYPWDTNYASATRRLAGARAPGDTFQHEANCLIEFESTTVPAALQGELHFRKQDATNYMAVTVNAAGDLELDEVVGGVTNQLGASAGVIVNGDRIMIRANGASIQVYESNVQRIITAVANNFVNETNGELATEGTGGSFSDIISWPRTLAGLALETLSRIENV